MQGGVSAPPVTVTINYEVRVFRNRFSAFPVGIVRLMPHETSLLYKDPRDKTQVYQAPAVQVRFRGRSGYVLPALGIDKKRVRLRDEAVETSVV